MLLAVGAQMEITQYATVVVLGADSPSPLRRRHLHQATASASAPLSDRLRRMHVGPSPRALAMRTHHGPIGEANSAHSNPHTLNHLTGKEPKRVIQGNDCSRYILLDICCLYGFKTKHAGCWANTVSGVRPAESSETTAAAEL